jgi:hypothetical protein
MTRQLGNGQCSHRLLNFGRCFDLATTSRAIVSPDHKVIYDVPLCQDHADDYDLTNGHQE